MTDAAQFASGKDHTTENFPVGSFLIAPRHRPVVMAFYRVARAADDIADHPTAAPADKLAALARIEDGLTGRSTADANAVALRKVLADHGLTDQHALDLLEAFRRDVTKTRYADWAELMDYCRYSAAPVGRFMLDVHGEDRSTWPASDALCAALQIINHLQDCAEDYREIDRVYVPLDALVEASLGVEALAEPKSSPALRGVITRLTQRTQGLLRTSRDLAPQVRDAGIGLEVSVIQTLAESMARRLLLRDPLSEETHHGKVETAGLALKGVGAFAAMRLGLSKGGKLRHREAP
ncbi:MAG: squalene synthase HpnC [Caulobacteraceae bacterium]|nr:squalene synthase HpnC [Caulobacteraceae bacterium]